MSTTSPAIINHSLFEDQNEMPAQMGFVPFPITNMSFPPLDCNQSLKAFSSIASSLASEGDSTSNLTVETLLATTALKSRSDHQYLTSSFGGPQFLSLHRSSVNPWLDNPNLVLIFNHTHQPLISYCLISNDTRYTNCANAEQTSHFSFYLFLLI